MYADVSCGKDCFTVAMCISGGDGRRIEKPMFIFQNRSCNYPISGVPDDIDCVTYRASKKGWMTQNLVSQYLAQSDVVAPLSGGRTLNLWIDSHRIMNETDDLAIATKSCRTELFRLQPNCTSREQPLDQLVLWNFKAEWWKRCYIRRNDLIKEAQYTYTGLCNPGKYYCLSLVKDLVRHLNPKSENGIGIARKSLISCELVPVMDGVWYIRQLTPQLRRIVQSNMPYLDGQNPNT